MTTLTHRPKFNDTLSLLIIAAMLTVLRGWNLWSRGILEHDEGHTLLNANTWHRIMRWALTGGPLQDNPEAIAHLRDQMHREGGTLYSAGKFGYSLLLATVALPGEVTQNLGLALAWFGGLLVMGFSALLTWQYTRNLPAALLVMLGIGTSPLLGYLGREVSGTTWALAFALAAACAMQAGAAAASRQRRWVWGLVGGFSLGYGFACHYNIAPFILAVFLATAVQAWQIPGRRKSAAAISGILPAAIGSLAVLAGFEAVTRIVDYRLRDIFPEYRSFFGELHHLFFTAETGTFKGKPVGDGVIGYGAQAWLYYGNVFWKEGPVLILLVLLAIPFAMRSREVSLKKLASASLLFLVPLLFWAAYAHRVERVLGMVVAAGWIFIGQSYGPTLFGPQGTRETWKVPAQRLVLFLIVIFAIQPWRQLVHTASPIPAVVRQTLNHVSKNDGHINAGSFHPGFGPLWKWTIVEQCRKPVYKNAMLYVDFSTTQNPEIVFWDPDSHTETASNEFPVSSGTLQQSALISEAKSENPPWKVQSFKLRTEPAGAL